MGFWDATAKSLKMRKATLEVELDKVERDLSHAERMRNALN